MASEHLACEAASAADPYPVEPSLVRRADASFTGRSTGSGRDLCRVACSERAGLGDDVTLNALCVEVFRGVGRCKGVADTSRDHDELDKNGDSRLTSW